jgi:hypothetical protein
MPVNPVVILRAGGKMTTGGPANHFFFSGDFHGTGCFAS